MIKLLIINIENFKYTLRDKENNEHILNIEFQGITPLKYDYLFINKELLMENIPLAFGLLDSSYGPKISSQESKNIIVLAHNNEKIYLKRIYG